jgi:tRNA threonylcarbamoyl adenosine modification protein YeaZ
MLVLASDTTGKSLSVALLRDGRLVGETRLDLGYNHAVTHMPQVMNLLKSCEIEIEAIDLFACTNGPGSFTGTRIGISSCKAMAYAAQKPAIGISTLETLAWPWREWPQAIICPLLDARNGRVYAAAYLGTDKNCQPNGVADSSEFSDSPDLTGSSGLTPLVAPGNYLASDFLHDLANALRDLSTTAASILLVGDGAETTRQAASSQADPLPWPIVRLDRIHDAPSAAVVALLAAMRYAAGANHDPFALEAKYLTTSSAERKKAKPCEP